MTEAAEFSTSSLKGLFFPRHCIVCDDVLEPGCMHVCPGCMADLPLTYFWDWVQNPQFERVAGRVQIESAASLFYFRKEAGYSRILYSIKYQGNRRLGQEMGMMLGDRLAESRFFDTVDAVVPVPLHPLRHWRRGYNQAEIIAQGIARAMDRPLVNDVVRRVKRTTTQTRRHAAQKGLNVKDAFVPNRVVAEKMTDDAVGHILIVDDVLTSGSTLCECAKVLLPYFKVSIASLAFVE